MKRLAEEVRVRPRRGMDDGVTSSDHLELVVVPGRALRALVLAVADLDGLPRQRFGRGLRIEDELGPQARYLGRAALRALA